jgi:hypothetical protein
MEADMNMMNMKLTVLLSGLLLTAAPPGRAASVTPAEAKEAAQGWVKLIERIKGHWGTAVRPEIGQVVALQASNRVVGYYCPVRSGGYVAVSSHKELEPVRAYSVRGGLDPQETRGPSGLVRGMLDRVVRGLEQRLGPLDTARPEQFQAVLKRDYRPAWKKLQDAAANPEGISPEDATYQSGGGVLLSTMWNQPAPYNWLCPNMNCGGQGCYGAYNNAIVGCVPLSGAQIMRYWCWPAAYGFEWTMMTNILDCSSPMDQVAAVAALCADVGGFMDTTYGCSATGAYLYNGPWDTETMEDSYQDNFEFDVDAGNDRSGTDAQWWNGIVAELSNKQPVQYAMNVCVDGDCGGHAFVVDGWETDSGSDMVHVNYGWGEMENTNFDGTTTTVLGWVSLNGLPYSTGDEGRLFNVVPANHIGPSVGGSYTGTYYFNQNASGADATFQPGSWLQFLPTVTVSNSGGSADVITFQGSAASPTTLLANGDPSKGILIGNGALKLAGGGCLRLVPQVPPRYPSAQWQDNGSFVQVAWERGYSDDETTVIERSKDGVSWVTVGTIDASVTSYADSSPTSPSIYRLRSSAGGCLSAPSDEAPAQ